MITKKLVEHWAREAGIPFNKYGLVGCDSCERDIDNELYALVELASKHLAQPEQSEPQPLEDLTGVKVCCGEYATCYRPCTPRGRWLAEREAPPMRELSESDKAVEAALNNLLYWTERAVDKGNANSDIEEAMGQYNEAVLAAARSLDNDFR